MQLRGSGLLGVRGFLGLGLKKVSALGPLPDFWRPTVLGQVQGFENRKG